jgi:hypothetical protein
VFEDHQLLPCQTCVRFPLRGGTCTYVTFAWRALLLGVFGWLQADTVAAVWIAAAAIHREKNTVEAAAAANKLTATYGANRTKQLFPLVNSYHPICLRFGKGILCPGPCLLL